MSENPKQTISFSDILTLELFRRKQNSPWTPADEARNDAKRKAEDITYDSWSDGHPTAEEESLGEEFDQEAKDLP